jgi:Phosphoesterase family
MGYKDESDLPNYWAYARNFVLQDRMFEPNLSWRLRMPGLVISPYARAGYVDHQTLSHDPYLKFIEDIFLAGRRIDPATDGRPDPRPDVREELPQLGDLMNDFDFPQAPRPPLILQPFPPHS